MIEVAPLPYEYGALAPYMSEATLRFHHSGHYARYVAAVNSRVDVDSVGAALVLADDRGDVRLREQAAQIHNHEHFFHSMAPPPERGNPSVGLDRALRLSLGTRARGLRQWSEAAASVFGSGWVWLTAEANGRLRIETTKDAGLPAGFPIMVMDVWEHAYYLDYPDARPRYAEVWLAKLVDWNRASQRYDAAMLR